MLTVVVPSLDGPPTGGTRYNRCLIEALRQLGEEPEVLSLSQARSAVTEPRERMVWVDSLWMSALPELVRVAWSSCRIGMLTHYLPALVSVGEAPPRSVLSAEEQAALQHAEGFIVPSNYLRRELEALGVEATRMLVLEPGIELPIEPYPADGLEVGAELGSEHGPLRAIAVANVTEGKGILMLLEGLARHMGASDALELVVVGSMQMESEYADRCAALVDRHPLLQDRIRLAGSCSYRECIERLLRADLLVSASRMESYGMALADARAVGRPILARAGGNVAAHVDPRWGGRLVPDAEHLVRALVMLARERSELRACQQRAWAHRPRRPWTEVASRLLAVGRWPPPRPPQ